jgi:hypothetical protein
MLTVLFVSILAHMLDILKEYICVFLFIYKLRKSVIRCNVFFILYGEDRWMFFFSIYVRYGANLYAGELNQIIMGHVNIGVLCSFSIA